MPPLHPDVERIRAAVENAAVELAGERSSVPLESDPFGDADSGTRAFVFGSSANGFGTSQSDVDVVVRAASWSLNLERLKGALGRQGFRILEHRSGARVPVLVCTYRGRSVDVSMNNLLPLKNTYWLRAHSDCDSRVREYVVQVKEWAKSKQISDASQGFFSAYAWSLLALFVLKYKNILSTPSLAEIRRGVWPRVTGRGSAAEWFSLFLATLRELVYPTHVLHPDSGRVERHAYSRCKEPFVLMDPWQSGRNLGDCFAKSHPRFSVNDPYARKQRVLQALGAPSGLGHGHRPARTYSERPAYDNVYASWEDVVDDYRYDAYDEPDYESDYYYD